MANRYNFTIHSKAKWGGTYGVPFITAYCPNDANAQSLANTLNDVLPNYASVSLSKTLMNAPQFDIPDEQAQLTDVDVVSWALATDGDTPARVNVRVPLPSENIVSQARVQESLLANTCTAGGQQFTKVLAVSTSFKNVVRDGGND